MLVDIRWVYIYIYILYTTLHQIRYPTTHINKGFELPEKVTQKELWNPKKAQ